MIEKKFFILIELNSEQQQQHSEQTWLIWFFPHRVIIISCVCGYSGCPKTTAIITKKTKTKTKTKKSKWENHLYEKYIIFAYNLYF